MYLINPYIFAKASWKPTDITGCTLWLDAGQGITKDINDYVSVWADQSGNGYNASQETGTYQPLWSGNTLNGNPVIRFDGSDDVLKTNSFTINNEYTYFAVWITTGTFDALCSQESGTYGYYNYIQYYQPNGVYGGCGEGNVIYAKPTFPTYIITSFTAKSNEAKIWENGIYKSQNSVYTILTTNAVFDIGRRGAMYPQYLHGNVAEIIIYNQILDTSDRQTVETYLNAKYAIY